MPRGGLWRQQRPRGGRALYDVETGQSKGCAFATLRILLLGDACCKGKVPCCWVDGSGLRASAGVLGMGAALEALGSAAAGLAGCGNQ